MSDRVMTRRALIGAAAIAVVGAALRWTTRTRRADEAGFVSAILSYRAPYATLDQRQRALFVADYLRHEAWRVRATLATLRSPLLYGRPVFTRLLTSPANRAQLTALERHVVTAYLLSCGYFERAQTGRTERVTYRGWPSACTNPFARRRTPIT